MRSLPAIYGIPCSLRSRRLRGAIRLVLGRIRRRAAEDFERIRARVREFTLLPEPLQAQGFAGMWKPDGSWGEFFTARGLIALTDRPGNLMAIVAHELGHACTHKEDAERRAVTLPGSRWAIEMCTNYYAYKWGFGRHMARARKAQDGLHRGPAPGETVLSEHEDEGLVYRYRATRGFYLPLVQIETPDGQVVETPAQIKEWRRRGWEQLAAKLKRGRRRPR